MKQRFRIDLSYDGTEYAGWQIQPNDMTVQEQIQIVLNKLTSENIKVHGSGRTDTGVHARNQVAHFDMKKEFTPRKLKIALNALLPDDIRINKTAIVASDFHARRSVVGKEYRYFILNTRVMPPFKRKYMTRVSRKLDVDAMREAASILVGKHDFTAFSANPKVKVETNVRHLYSLTVNKKGAEIVIKAVGEGFLYKMVRSLTGYLVKVGEGVEDTRETRKILKARKRIARVPTAPPQGLFLWDVKY